MNIALKIKTTLEICGEIVCDEKPCSDITCGEVERFLLNLKNKFLLRGMRFSFNSSQIVLGSAQFQISCDGTGRESEIVTAIMDGAQSHGIGIVLSAGRFIPDSDPGTPTTC